MTGQSNVSQIVKPVFRWSSGTLTGDNAEWVRKIREDHQAALQWFNAQNFSLPTGMGEAFAAEYCYDMAYKAESAQIYREASGGYHWALRAYLNTNNRKMVAMACYRLGNVHGAQRNFALAQLYFIHSAYLANQLNDRKGYALSLFYAGDTFEQLGHPAKTHQFWKEALTIMCEVSPDDASGINKALQRLEREHNLH